MIQWTKDFRNFTVISASSEAADFPRARIADRIRPNRAWRSTDTSQQDLVLDLGASVSFAAVALHHANFATVELEHSDDAVAYTPFDGSPFAVAQDLKDGYRKLFVATEHTARYIRVRIPAQAPTDGAGYFFVGTIFVAESLSTFPDSADPRVPVQVSLERPELAQEIAGRVEVTPAGDFYTEHVWRGFAPEADLTDWQRIGVAGSDTPILAFWNRGASEEVYFLRYRGGIRFEHGGVNSEVNLVFRQVV